MVLWIRRLQFCYRGRRCFEKWPENFSSRSEIYGEKKNLTKKTFNLKCYNGQTKSSIDDAPEIFLSKWRKKFRSMPNDEQTKELIPEKISSTDPLGNVNAVLSTWPK